MLQADDVVDELCSLCHDLASHCRVVLVLCCSRSPNKLRCTTRGIISGMKPNMFSGMKPAVNFRNAVFAKFNIETTKHPPKKLLIYNRANAGRRFENIEDIERLLKRYEIPYEIRASAGSFEDQVSARNGRMIRWS